MAGVLQPLDDAPGGGGGGVVVAWMCHALRYVGAQNGTTFPLQAESYTAQINSTALRSLCRSTIGLSPATQRDACGKIGMRHRGGHERLDRAVRGSQRCRDGVFYLDTHVRAGLSKIRVRAKEGVALQKQVKLAGLRASSIHYVVQLW